LRTAQSSNVKSKATFFSTKPEFASEFAINRVGPEDIGGKVYKNTVLPQKIFDPANPEKVSELVQILKDKGVDPQILRVIESELKAAPTRPSNWHIMEDPLVQEAMKDARYDSFKVREAGVNNIGVFNPDIVEQSLTKSQRKEAIKNIKDKLLKSKTSKIIDADKAYAEELMKKVK
jgi:hypothetical protein